MKSLILFVSSILFFSTLSFSAEKLMSMNFGKEGSVDVNLQRVDHTSQKLSSVLIQGKFLKDKISQKIDENKVIDLISKKQSITIIKQKGMDALTLQPLSGFDTTQGGPLKLTYLKSPTERVTSMSELIYDSSVDQWWLTFNFSGKTIRVKTLHAKIIVMPVIGPVGIEYIDLEDESGKKYRLP